MAAAAALPPHGQTETGLPRCQRHVASVITARLPATMLGHCLSSDQDRVASDPDVLRADEAGRARQMILLGLGPEREVGARVYRTCRIEDVALVHAYAQVGMIIRDWRSPERGSLPSQHGVGRLGWRLSASGVTCGASERSWTGWWLRSAAARCWAGRDQVPEAVMRRAAADDLWRIGGDLAGSVMAGAAGLAAGAIRVRRRRRLPTSTRAVTVGRSSRAGGSSSPVTRRNCRVSADRVRPPAGAGRCRC